MTESSEELNELVRLFSKHQRRIPTFILALLTDRDLAQDVMQNTFVVLWQGSMSWISFDLAARAN